VVLDGAPYFQASAVTDSRLMTISHLSRYRRVHPHHIRSRNTVDSSTQRFAIDSVIHDLNSQQRSILLLLTHSIPRMSNYFYCLLLLLSTRLPVILRRRRRPVRTGSRFHARCTRASRGCRPCALLFSAVERRTFRRGSPN